MTCYIFNTTILTTTGLTYRSSAITVDEAKHLLNTSDEIVSAIGHDATALIASELFGRSIPVNRIAAKMAPGDTAVCMKLHGRVAEGAILTREQVEAVGYELVRLDAYDDTAGKLLVLYQKTIDAALAAPSDESPSLTIQRIGAIARLLDLLTE